MEAATRKSVELLREHLEKTAFCVDYAATRLLDRGELVPAELIPPTRLRETGLAGIFQAPVPRHAVASCLLVDAPASMDALEPSSRPVAEALVEAGLLRLEGGALRRAEARLCVLEGVPLLVDATGVVPFDAATLQLAFYVDPGRGAAPALDLACGAGALAVLLSRHGGPVVGADVSPRARHFAGLNRILARREGALDLRAVGILEALTDSGPWRTITLRTRTQPADATAQWRALLDAIVTALAPEGVAWLAAELPGDDARPDAYLELEAAAAERGLRVDAYLERRRRLTRSDPSAGQASHAFLTVMAIRHARLGAPRLRGVFRARPG